MISSFWGLSYTWIRGELPSQGLGDNSMCMPNILPCIFVLQRSLNWASGLISLSRLHMKPLQRHFHSLGLTNRFTLPCRSDPLVIASQWQDLSFLTSGIPIRPFQAEFPIFTDASTQGRPHGRFPKFGCLDSLRTHQCAGAQGGNIGPSTLGLSITGSPCYDRYRQYHCCGLYQQTG